MKPEVSSWNFCARELYHTGNSPRYSNFQVKLFSRSDCQVKLTARDDWIAPAKIIYKPNIDYC